MDGVSPTALGGVAVGTAEVILRSYSNIIFSRSKLAGLLLLLGSALDPRALTCALVSIAAASGITSALQLERRAMAEGPYGYNAVLFGLGVAHVFGPFHVAFAIACAGGALSVLVTASLTSALARSALPVLSIPFVAVSWLAHSALPASWMIARAPGSFLSPERTVGVGLIESLGAILCMPRFDVGLIVALALLCHSRIASLLAAATCAMLAPWVVTFSLAVPGQLHTIVFNAVLAAIALGGVWFVPSPASFALGLGAAAGSVPVSLALARGLAHLALTPLIGPFLLVVLGALLALRQRTCNDRPQAVDFAPGSPEQNAVYARVRAVRGLAPSGPSFRLPFRGTWACTQGVDGPLTHQGPWKYAFDFEVQGNDARLAHGTGERLDDYHCFRLPVLATADGTVVRIENAIVDNPVGGMNLAQNWGNFVVIYHAPGLYSLVGHLAKGSVRVREGQLVRAGEPLGSCGNSGRSPRPHLHFQLQSTQELGAPTLPCRFEGVVVLGDGVARLLANVSPGAGELVRNPEPDASMVALLTFVPGTRLTYLVEGKNVELSPEIDLLGRYLLRAGDGKSGLYFDSSDEGFRIFEGAGPPSQLLRIFRAALPRVPWESHESLRWRDSLPFGWERSTLVRLCSDVVLPFAPAGGHVVEYRMHRAGPTVVITGASLAQDRHGRALLRTRAELVRGGAPAQLSLEIRDRAWSAVRVEAHPEASREATDRSPERAPRPTRHGAPTRALGAHALEET